jgi:predicted AAA+ superfamily ATPase
LFSPSVNKQNVNSKKVYCIDHSLTTSVSPGILANRGHLLENLIFVHLRQRTEDLYYYRTEKGKEVDFIWLGNQNTKNLVQVTFTLNDPLTKKRETSSMFQAMDELSIQESTIVTMDDEDIIEEYGKKIAWRIWFHIPGVINSRFIIY